jgi:stearoyl-CoA desaturase (Delta-9 desaturase)
VAATDTSPRSVTAEVTERMLAVPGTEPMTRGYRRVHRSFVVFNTVVPLLALLVAGFGLWGVAVTPLDLGLLIALHVLTTLGITVGFHRQLTHQGFRSRTWVRAVFAVLGTAAMQGPVIKWVAEHRRHHAYSDRDGDPHSPHIAPGATGVQLLRGLWWAHVGWMFAPVTTDPRRWAPDLLRDPVVRRIDRLYVPIVLGSLGVPAAIGLAVTGTGAGAVRALVWGGLIRILIQLHTTWSINSICHVFGIQRYESHDEAANVWWLAVPSLGEAWHNNHHAFPASPRHGLDRRQLDPSAWVIETLARTGQVWDLKLPSTTQRERRRRHPRDTRGGAAAQPTSVRVPASRREK